MHLGKNESLNETNGGAIANTGFIVGEESVLVIDAGPSYLYALEMIKFIRETTNADIKIAESEYGVAVIEDNFGNLTVDKKRTRLLRNELSSTSSSLDKLN